MKNTTVRELAQRIIILCNEFKAKKITDMEFSSKLLSLASNHGEQLYDFEGLSPTIKAVIGKKRVWMVEHFLNSNIDTASSLSSENDNTDEYIIKEIISNQGLPYNRSKDSFYIDIAVKHLMSWRELIELYKGKELEIYKLIVNRIIYMSCMSQEKDYKGYKVSSRTFIEKLNEYIIFPECIFDDIIVGELVKALEITLNTYSITDIFKYTETFIWDYLVTCRLKLEMQF